MLLTISLVGSLVVLFSSPVTMLSAFMMIAVILYSWFSFRFRRQVLQQQQVVKHSLRDWVRVNGIVTLVFCVVSILGVLPLLHNPQAFMDALKNMGVQMPLKSLTGFFYGMLAYAVILFVHILWTFALLKKYEKHFE